VIGIWSHISADGGTPKKQGGYPEAGWIFNDAYLGRYPYLSKQGKLTIISDFKWVRKDSLYVISYPGLERKKDKCL